MSGVGVGDVVQSVVTVLFLANQASQLAKAVKHCKGTRSNSPKNSVDQGDANQKEALATVILALFTGEMKTYGHAEASTYGWSVNLVHLKKAEIPENIDRSVKSSALERTVRRIVGLKAKKGFWTVEELRAGLMAAYVPDESQVFNGDEVGFDPSGTWARVLSLKGDRVNAMVGTGEKAPFWATLFFISRADGQVVVPPTVVHQGVTGQNKQSSMIIGTGRRDRDGALQTQYLPQGWNVHQTPSGYMDKLGFRHAMDYFISYCGLP